MTIRGSTTETRLARSAGPMPEVGHLVVDIHFGVAHHRIEGPMGLYPRGVVEIVKAVQAARDEHERLATRVVRIGGTDDRLS